MKRTFAFAVAAIGLASAAAADPIAGYDRFEVTAPHRAAPVAASVWYPVGTPTYRGLIGDNPVFEGTSAYVGAAIAEGKFPLVLVSHGSGGNMDRLSWLSSRLALHGAMVLAVNHPGSTSGDSSPRRSVRLSRAGRRSPRRTRSHFGRSRLRPPHRSLAHRRARLLTGRRYGPQPRGCADGSRSLSRLLRPVRRRAGRLRLLRQGRRRSV